MCYTWIKEKRLWEEFIMRNFYNKGGPTLTKAQQTLPDALKKQILGSKKNKKEKKPSAMMMAMKGKK